MRKLTFNEKIGLGAFIVAVIAVVVAVTVPEIRLFLHLDKPGVASTAPKQPVPSPKVEESKPLEPQPEPPKRKKKKATTNQSSKTAVQGNGNTAGNNVSGDNNVVGNGNTVNSPSTTINGNVFVSPPPSAMWPKINWEAYTPKPGEDPNVKVNLPRAYAKIYLSASLPDAKFAILCDNPCQAAFHSSVDGMNSDLTFKMNNVPAIAGIWIRQPNPFPADTNYIIGVESMDEKPVSILGMRFWDLNEAQKSQLRELAPH